MKIVTGIPARADDFFNREELIESAWEMIASGKHILIVAPRRVGKTSMMFYLMDHPRENYDLLYINTESINNQNEFFRRVLNQVLKTDFIKKSKKIATFLEKHKPTIKKVGMDGVEFGVSEEHDYLDMLSRVLKSSAPEAQKLIIMIDEFPQTLANINTDEDESAAIQFLQSNRELRQNPDTANNVQFIYAGSIGLENIVSKMNAVNTINDLSRLKVPPLKTKKAKQLVELLLENVDFALPENLIEDILQKIEWLIPFYIQLIIEEIKNLHRDEHLEQITEDTVNQAFEEILEQRQHLEHWHTRLRASMKSNEYNFVKELLSIASENGRISANEINDLANKYQVEQYFTDIVNALEYDGYINNRDEERFYTYNSPILRMWWRKNVAN